MAICACGGVVFDLSCSQFISYGVYMAMAPYTDPADDKLAQFTQIAVFVALVSKVVLVMLLCDSHPAHTDARL